ncbi:hypothetical protein XI03_35415 [Bradyrhizobium sp. CCBAU 65884]|uniref:hypothetical protein n=1 Tax=Bradyrhizobium sp. CCBAU 65884 TaxID=722477 RepID=UPI0023060C3B|nr:hypothetical protein [Bradyrhizobium sp. CCBAU 65884]MDA9479691.1 hypothetical protein [Bradyrhizobium sp. CCBAU 65884]
MTNALETYKAHPVRSHLGEPIIEREVFLKANKIIEERRVDLAEGEMIARLRKTLLKEGRLSSAIIDSTSAFPALPPITNTSAA